jgi:hypothetical protein
MVIKVMNLSRRLMRIGAVVPGHPDVERGRGPGSEGDLIVHTEKGRSEGGGATSA